MKKIILFILLVVSAFSKMEFVNPKPTFEHPRKWVIQLNYNDVKRVNHTLGAIYNVLKEYPSESINISVVTYAY